MAASRGLLTDEDENKVGRSFPVMVRVTAWLVRASRKPSSAGQGSSKTLVSHPSLRKGDANSPFQ